MSRHQSTSAAYKRQLIGSLLTAMVLDVLIIGVFGPFASMTAILIGCSTLVGSRLLWWWLG